MFNIGTLLFYYHITHVSYICVIQSVVLVSHCNFLWIDVDVLQADATPDSNSITFKEEEEGDHKIRQYTLTACPLHVGNEDSDKRHKVMMKTVKESTESTEGGGGGNTDDLRNYAYEGEGSSPGSLSSCKFS